LKIAVIVLRNIASGKLILTTILVQLILFTAILLNIPIVRQITGFIYLLFLPGVFFLKIFKISTDDVITAIVLSAGLSLVFLMFLGVLMNIFYPIFGFPNPLSPTKVLLTVSVALIVLCGIAYRQDHALPQALNSVFRSRTYSLALIALPIVGILLPSIVGAQLVLESSANSLVLVMFIAIPLFVTLVTFRSHIAEVVFPATLLAISVGLLLHISLASPYLVGFDVHAELNILDYSLASMQWDASLQYNYGGMLSITVLPVIFSAFLNLSSIWVFKIVNILIYSLVPLALFRVYNNQTTARIAFLSVFFFMAYNQFYLGMPGLVKQMIGEVFFVLLILLLVDQKQSVQTRRILSLIFGAGLIVSHYALAYIYLGFIIVTFIISRWRHSQEKRAQLINGLYLLEIGAFLLAWYTFSAQSEIALSLFELVEQGIMQLLSELGGGWGHISTPYSSPLHDITLYVFVGFQIVIVLGVLSEILRWQKSRFNKDYLVFSLLSVGVLFTCIFIPYLADALTIYRLYQIMLMLLAPFFIIGIFTVSSILRTRTRTGLIRGILTRASREENEKRLLIPIVAFLIMFFLLQSGFIYEILGDPYPTSMPLSEYRANPVQHFDLYAPYTSQLELESAQYLSRHRSPEMEVYADFGSIHYVLTSTGVIPPQDLGTRFLRVLEPGWPGLPSGSYIYLRRLNLLGKMEGPNNQLWNLQDIAHLLEASVIIYANTDSIIYQVT
jgi:uncharacterized membrane protein